jgi:PAP2 superfamily
MLLDSQDLRSDRSALSLRERSLPVPKDASRSRQWRAVVAGPLIALVAFLAALIATDAAGIPIRDPDHVAGRRLLGVFWMVGLLIVLDIVIRACRRSHSLRPRLGDIAFVWRERWTLRRGVAVGTALLSFYATYLAYRNLKSVVPLLRPGDLFDGQLATIDRTMLVGHDPANLLHSLFGTSWLATQVFSNAYMLFFAFIPATLAFALVFSPNLQAGLFYVTAQSLNWVLGAASYFLLPSLGPVYANPVDFGAIQGTGATRLQEILMQQRLEFLHDPLVGNAQSVAAFSSLHVSIFFTGALAAHVLGLRRGFKAAAWFMLAMTATATIYLGWHYIVDDIGGLAIGAMAVLLARALTGFELGSARRQQATAPAPAT